MYLCCVDMFSLKVVYLKQKCSYCLIGLFTLINALITDSTCYIWAIYLEEQTTNIA